MLEQKYTQTAPLQHHTLSHTHIHTESGPPAGTGGRLGDLVSAGRQLQTTVPGLLPGGNAKQDSVRRRRRLEQVEGYKQNACKLSATLILT